MKDMGIVVKHTLGAGEAKRRLEHKIDQLKGRYGGKFKLDSDWRGNRLDFHLSVSGVKTEGFLEVTETEVLLSGTVPMLARAFKKQIESSIKKELETLLSR